MTRRRRGWVRCLVGSLCRASGFFASAAALWVTNEERTRSA